MQPPTSPAPPLAAALALLLGAACTPTAEAPGAVSRYFLVDTLEFVLEDDSGLGGFDLDGSDADCGVEDGISPDGDPGIDNQLGAIWDVLPDSAIAVLPLAVETSLESGAMMLVLEVTESGALVFWEGTGRPLLGSNLLAMPNQTIDLLAGADRLGGAESTDTEGGLRAEALDVVLKLEWIDTQIAMPVVRGRGLLREDGAGGLDLSLGGLVPMQAVMDVVAGLGGDGDDMVAETLSALLPLVVDGRTDPEGECDGLSGAFVGHAVPVYLFEE